MKVKVKKLWHGSVSVRDYIVKECHQKGEDLTIEYDGKVMTVPNGMLLFGHKNKMTNVSQFKEETYDLIDFFWRPDAPKPPEDKQQTLL